MSTEIPTPDTKPDRPLMRSDLIDSLARLENGFENRAEYFRNDTHDPHHIATAMMIAMTECREVIKQTVKEILERP